MPGSRPKEIAVAAAEPPVFLLPRKKKMGADCVKKSNEGRLAGGQASVLMQAKRHRQTDALRLALHQREDSETQPRLYAPHKKVGDKVPCWLCRCGSGGGCPRMAGLQNPYLCGGVTPPKAMPRVARKWPRRSKQHRSEGVRSEGGRVC